MTKVWQTRFAALAAVVLALLVTGCGSSDDGSQSSLRVGYAFGTDAGDTGDLLAYEQLGKAGLPVEVSSTGSPENAVAALRRGSIDIAVLNQPALIQAISQGAPLEAIVAQNMTSESTLVGRGVDSVKELEGKRVAVGFGHAGTALVGLAARAAGLPAGSVHVRALPESTARAVGLREGRLQAAELDASDLIRLENSLPDLVVLARLSDYKLVTGQLAFVTRPDFAEQHRALLRQFVAGILAASATLYGPEGRTTFIRIALANALKGDSAELAGKTYDYYRSVGMWPRSAAPITAGEYRKTMQFFKDTGQIESEVPFSRAWNLSYWKPPAAPA